MAKRVELRFSGVGGQGAILAGAILAEAAVYFDGKYALQSPTYTAQVRGGATKVDIIISEEPIIFPQTSEINFFLAFAQRSYDRYYGGNNPKNRFFRDLAKDAIILVDSDLVTNFNDPPHKIIKLPILQLALKELGRTVFSNVLALGIVVGITHVVSDDAIKNAVKRRAPRGTEEMNLKALDIGYNFAKEYTEKESLDSVTV